MDSNISVSERRGILLNEILEPVALRENCDTLDLPPLHDYVETDALLTLCASGSVEARFGYMDYEVHIKDGKVRID